MSADKNMRELVRSFPTLFRTPDELLEPFDSEGFAQYWATGSGGEQDAALFVLSVWNPSTDWAEYASAMSRPDGAGGYVGRFTLHTALQNWDAAHLAAFIQWAKAPWWP